MEEVACVYGYSNIPDEPVWFGDGLLPKLIFLEACGKLCWNDKHRK